MEKKEISLKKLSELAGCSPSAVCRALSGSPKVSQELRRRVLQLAKSSGYRSVSQNVAVILPAPTGYFSYMLRLVWKRLMEEGLTPVVIPSECMDSLEEIPLSGGIMLTDSPDYTQLWCSRYNLPLITINTLYPTLQNVHSIVSDDFQGIGMMMRMLAQMGHRNIGILGDMSLFKGSSNFNNRRRMEAYDRSRVKYGFDQIQLLPCEYDMKVMLDFVRRFADSGLTALVLGVETYAPMFFHAAEILKLRLPEQFSVTGLAYEHEVQDYNLPMNYITQDFKKLADSACGLLKQCLKSEPIRSMPEIPYIYHLGASIRSINVK